VALEVLKKRIGVAVPEALVLKQLEGEIKAIVKRMIDTAIRLEFVQAVGEYHYSARLYNAPKNEGYTGYVRSLERRIEADRKGLAHFWMMRYGTPLPDDVVSQISEAASTGTPVQLPKINVKTSTGSRKRQAVESRG